MARSRNQLQLRPINRIKHVIDLQGGILLGVQTTLDIAQASDTPVRGTPDLVETGSRINGIYLDVEVYATSTGALSNIYLTVFKNPSNQLAVIAANAVGISDQKKFVIHQEMVMVQRNINGNPRTLFKGVIALPKHYRRMGPSDRLQIALLAPGINFDFCVQCHYKEFR